MGRLADATGSPVFWEHEGKKYVVSQIDPSDLGLLQRWLEDTPYDECRRALERLGDQATPEVRQQLIQEAKAEVDRLKTDGVLALQKLTTIDGVSYAFWLCLRKAHPELTEQYVREHMVTWENLSLVSDVVDEVSGLMGKDEEGETAAAPQEEKSRRQEAS